MFDSRWHKVIRDLWDNKTRTFLIVLSIAVGVFAFGSSFIAENVLIADMNAQFEATHPSTITLSLKSFDSDLVHWIARQPEIIDAQGRSVYAVKIIKSDGEVNLDVYAADDLSKSPLNQLVSETGAWPPDKGQILLERQSVELSGAKPGGTIIVETPNGRKHELTFAGTVHDLNTYPANLFPQLSGYVSTRTLAAIGLPGDYNRLDIQAQPQYDSVDKLSTLANKLKQRLEDMGLKVDSVTVREPNEHWARSTTQGFSLILTVIGFFSLVLSGFLVINTVSALLTDQRRHIGIMKAIGGTSSQIMSIYLVLVAVYGLLALCVAVPVGLLLGYYFTSAVTNFLNINLINYHLPLQVLLLQIGAALAVPLIASAAPIMGGVRVTVREAISSHGVQGGRAGAAGRLLRNTGFLPRPLLLSLRNTFRRKGRLMLTLCTLALAGTLFITVVNVRSSLNLELDNLLNTVFNFEVFVGLDGNYAQPGVEAKVERVPGVVRAEGETTINAQYTRPDGSRSASFMVSGMSPTSDFVQPQMLSGRWLLPTDRNALVLSSKLASEWTGVRPGDEVTLWTGEARYRWKVVGVMFNSFTNSAYGVFDYVSNVAGHSGEATSVYIRIDPSAGDQSTMAKRIEAGLKKSGVGVTQTMTKDIIVASNASQFDFMIAFLLTMAAMTALIGGLGLAGMMSLNVMERTREIGIMRSIGASHGSIAGIVTTEGLLIGLISWAMAIPLSIPFSLVFNSLLGQIIIMKPLTFVFEPLTILIWLVIVMIIATIASLLPAFHAARMSIRETLAYE